MLTSEQALAAAVVYVDLNPIRAGIAAGVLDSHDTSVKQRTENPAAHPESAQQTLAKPRTVTSQSLRHTSERLDGQRG